MGGWAEEKTNKDEAKRKDFCRPRRELFNVEGIFS